jgi:hypothetical protein
MKRQYVITFERAYIYAENEIEAEERARKIFNVNIQYVKEDERYRKANNIRKKEE